MSEKSIFTQEEFDTYAKISAVLRNKLEEATKQSGKSTVNLTYIFNHCFTFTEEGITDDQFQTFLKNSNIISEWFNAGIALNETLEEIIEKMDKQALTEKNSKPDHEQDLDLRKKFNVDGNL